MEQEPGRIRIELTEEQKDLIKQASGKTISALEFTAEELEERVVPTSFSFGSVSVSYKPQNADGSLG